MEDYKISITGHTKGLGKVLYNKCSNAIGFSRTNGYDIQFKESRYQIIQESLNSDVFINNAYCGDFSQTHLLYELFDVWKHSKKLIINIGSETTSSIKNKIWPYSIHKFALEKSSEQCSFQNNDCKVTLIKFGYINSDRVIKTINPDNYICIDDAAEFILNNIKIAFKYRLTEVLIRP